VIANHMRWADTAAVDLVLFPEAFLLGHSYDPEKIALRASQVSNSTLDELCRNVADFQATLIVGGFERRDGHIFNSAFVIERGHIIGRYAKAHPNEPGISPGSDFSTFVRSGCRYGMNICNDANHADAAGQLARQGARLILYPLNNMLKPVTATRWRAKSLINLQNRACETNCWIASSDVTGETDGLISYGCTAIIAPDGQVMAQVPEQQEGIVIHDVPSETTLFPAC